MSGRGISLMEWEEMTRLTEEEYQSVHELQKTCAELPLPSNWYFNDKLSGSPILSSGTLTPEAQSTTLNPHVLVSRLMGTSLERSLSTTSLLAEAAASVEKDVASKIGTDKPIDTLQEFFDWFASVESEMEKDQENIYRNFLLMVQSYHQACDEFLNDVTECSQLFKNVEKDYSDFNARMRSIQTASSPYFQPETSNKEPAKESDTWFWWLV